MNYFRAQALNNFWANHRLLSACAALAEEEYRAPRVGFFPSIQATLCHILHVDAYYFAALIGDLTGQKTAGPETLGLEELARRQRAQDSALVEFCSTLDPQCVVKLLREEGQVQVCVDERTDRILLHLFEHQIHHRGQVHCMLSATPVAPPQLDEFFLAADERFRRLDMRDLKLPEADVWLD